MFVLKWIQDALAFLVVEDEAEGEGESMLPSEKKNEALKKDRENLLQFIQRSDLSEDERQMADFVDAASEGNIEYLRKHLYLMNGLSHTKECALVSAASAGHLHVIELFTEQGSALQIDIKDAQGATALMESAGHGYTKIVETLLSAGASPKRKDNHGWTAFHYAASAGNVEILEMLAKAGSDVQCRARSGETNALYLAAHENKLNNVKYLLSLLLDPRIKDVENNKPSDVAEDIEICTLLSAAEELWNSAERTLTQSSKVVQEPELYEQADGGNANPIPGHLSSERIDDETLKDFLKPKLDILLQ